MFTLPSCWFISRDKQVVQVWRESMAIVAKLDAKSVNNTCLTVLTEVGELAAMMIPLFVSVSQSHSYDRTTLMWIHYATDRLYNVEELVKSNQENNDERHRFQWFELKHSTKNQVHHCRRWTFIVFNAKTCGAPLESRNVNRLTNQQYV
jgi:hypothetical protein